MVEGQNQIAYEQFSVESLKFRKAEVIIFLQVMNFQHCHFACQTIESLYFLNEKYHVDN